MVRNRVVLLVVLPLLLFLLSSSPALAWYSGWVNITSYPRTAVEGEKYNITVKAYYQWEDEWNDDPIPDGGFKLILYEDDGPIGDDIYETVSFPGNSYASGSWMKEYTFTNIDLSSEPDREKEIELKARLISVSGGADEEIDSDIYYVNIIFKEITDAFWASSSSSNTTISSATDNQPVWMIVKTTGCDGKQVKFEIYESDWGSTDDYVTTKYGYVSNGRASVKWNADWQSDPDSPPNPEFYFKATIANVGTKKSAKLQVDNPPPKADADGDYYGSVGESIRFDGTGSSDGTYGEIVSYSWDFGDGHTGSGEKPSHSYSKGGTYTVTLTVKDDEGATDQDTAKAYINSPPVADPDGPYSGKIGEPIQFDGSGSYDPDGDSLTYSWNFGDGNSGSGVSPTHTYEKAGTYVVTLTVTDEHGATGSGSTQATITHPKGNLQVKVKNVNGEPVEGALVKLYTSNGTHISDKQTHSDGKTDPWTNLDVGDYYIKVYYDSPTGFTEYWGRLDCKVTEESGDDLVEFTRNMPYIEKIRVYDRCYKLWVDAGSPDDWKPYVTPRSDATPQTFTYGGKIYFVLTVKNPDNPGSGVQQLYSAKIRIKNFDKVAEGVYRGFSLQPGESIEIYVPWKIDDTIGTGSWAIAPVIYVNNPSTVTDSWDFSTNDATRMFRIVDKTPVVLVHGLGGNPSSFGELERLLEEDGFAVESFYYSTAPDEKTINDCAKELADFVQPYIDDGSKVSFVAHSMGGLVVRAWRCGWYPGGVSHRNDSEKFITLGTPHYGRDHSNWLIIGGDTINRQLDYGSYFVGKLNILDKFTGNELIIIGTHGGNDWRKDISKLPATPADNEDALRWYHDSLVAVTSANPYGPGTNLVGKVIYIPYSHSNYSTHLLIGEKEVAATDYRWLGIAHIEPPYFHQNDPRAHLSYPIIRDFLLTGKRPENPCEYVTPNLEYARILVGAIEGNSPEPVLLSGREGEKPTYTGTTEEFDLVKNEWNDDFAPFARVYFKPSADIVSGTLKITTYTDHKTAEIPINVQKGRTSFVVVKFADPCISVDIRDNNGTPITTHFSISSPLLGSTLEGNGSTSFENLPLGEYTITYSNIPGYDTPPSETKILTAEGAILFTGIYKVQTGTVKVTSNPSGAPFTINGPHGFSYSGKTPWNKDDAPVGDYVITWEELAGYDLPSPSTETKYLPKDGSVNFYGDYKLQIGSIKVETNLSQATFTLEGDCPAGDVDYSGSGTSWTKDNARVGIYTIHYGEVEGWDLPTSDGEQKTLTKGGIIEFEGIYTKKHVTLNVSSDYDNPVPPIGANDYEWGEEVHAYMQNPVFYVGENTRKVCTGWNGTGSVPPSGSGSEIPLFNITRKSSIKWLWETQYKLTTSVNPSEPEGGYISKSPDDAEGWYNENAEVELKAHPNPGYGFDHWSGDIDGWASPPGHPEILSGPMDKPRVIVANFAPEPDFAFEPTPEPSSRTIAPGDTTSYVISLTWLNEFNSPVTLSVTNISPNPQTGSIDWEFSPNPVVNTQSESFDTSTLTVYTTPDTSVGAYTLTITGEGGGKTHTTEVTLKVGIAQSIPLVSGWNLISLQVEPFDTSVENVFSSIWENVSAVWTYNTSENHWYRYVKEGPPMFNDLTEIHARKGYWIFMNEEDMLEVIGVEYDNNINLVEGWNLVGIKGFDSSSVPDDLSNIEGKYESIWSYDAEEDRWYRYIVDGPPFLNDLTSMEKGKGYWIYVKEKCVW